VRLVHRNQFYPHFGWGEADLALHSVIEAGVKDGVVSNASGILKFSIDDSGPCIGLQTEDGGELNADHIILCTGARTSRLLLNSAQGKRELHVGDRMLAAGAIQRRTPRSDVQIQNHSRHVQWS
jgi:sarcosine oxidase/L-pipecolate oxidase